MSTRRFGNEGSSVGETRRFVAEALTGAPPEVIELAELMVSELATNCVRHAGGAFDVAVSRNADRIRIAVTDRAKGEPVLRSPGPSDPTGRGLRIVEALSSEWGVEHARSGKTVWFTLEAPAGAPSEDAGAHAAPPRSLQGAQEHGPRKPRGSRVSPRLFTDALALA
jgi:anti-sigma regulatory factor (Ser/Thr protein kinase)